MDEYLVLSMLLCLGLAVMGLKMRMWPVTFISSIGWVIIGCEIFNESESWLALGLIIMVALTQIILVKDSES